MQLTRGRYRLQIALNAIARVARSSSLGVRIGVVLVVILIAAALVLIWPNGAIASSPVLSVISGDVLVRPTAEAPPRAGQDGEAVTAGTSVQAEAPNGRAVLTFRDGSTIELEPGTTIAIGEVSLGKRGEIIVRLGQSRGRSWMHVQPLLSPNSRFHITTPSATAVVRGTSFEIDVVGSNGGTVTTVNVFQGQVDMVAAGAVQTVTASQTTTVVQGSAPQPAKQIRWPPVCLRIELTSTALMTATDPYGRSAGRTPRGTVSQIPQATVNAPRNPPSSSTSTRRRRASGRSASSRAAMGATSNSSRGASSGRAPAAGQWS